MMAENNDSTTDFNAVAIKYIDALSGRAKAILEISSPFVEEIATAVRSFRAVPGARSPDRRDPEGDAQDLGAMALGVLGRQVKRQPLASLAVAGALAAAGYYIVRAQKAG